MKNSSFNPPPPDADTRRATKPVIAYPVETLAASPMLLDPTVRQHMKKVSEVVIAPRTAKAFEVPAGHFFRIVSSEGPQVGDLNLFNRANLNEHFYSGKTRALHGTHLSTGDRLWSRFPWLRPLATITWDTLDWYGFDDDGASVHDVIGTRCDPYTHHLLTGEHYHHCCHSNLLRALCAHSGLSIQEAEPLVHDVLNVFMCTGFTEDTHQYFMKASPVRPGDYLEFYAEVDLLGVLSACPGGDCGASHSSDEAACHPLLVETYKPASGILTSERRSENAGYAHPTSV
ncbi:MAG: urea carboxylase-associated family protein [Saccharospirillum sp.]